MSVLGPGANAGEGAFMHQIEAVTVAKECLLAAVKVDPRAGPLWVNLANAYYVSGDHRSAKKCLEKVKVFGTLLLLLFLTLHLLQVLIHIKTSETFLK